MFKLANITNCDSNRYFSLSKFLHLNILLLGQVHLHLTHVEVEGDVHLKIFMKIATHICMYLPSVRGRGRR